MTDTFDNINIDKIEKTKLIVEIEDYYGINFSDREFLSIETPFDCVILVNKYISAEMSLKNSKNYDLN